MDDDWPDYHRGSQSVFILFLGYVVYWYLQVGYRVPALGAIRFEFLMGAVLSSLAIPAYWTNPCRSSCGIGTWVVMLFSIMIIMSFFSYAPYSYDVFVDRVFKFSMLGFFIAAFVTTPERLFWFICAFLLACLKMGQEGFVGTITGSLIWENQGVMRLHGVTPNYGHPNSFSGMALGSLPFALYFFRIVPWYMRLLLLAQSVFALNIILHTGSRTGYVGLAVGILFIILKSQYPIRAIIITLFLGCVLTPFIPNQYIERAQSILTEEDKEGHSIEKRKEILGDAWQIFLDNPLGVGVAAFPLVRQERFGRFQDTHQLYLEIATNLGVEGIIVFGGFIFVLLRSLLQLTKNIKSQIARVEKASKTTPFLVIACSDRLEKHLRDLKIMQAASQAVYVFLVIRLTLGLFGHDLYEVYWWFASGMTVAIWNINIVAWRRTDLLYMLHDKTSDESFTCAGGAISK